MKDAFSFVEVFDPNLIMASFDVKSLFTNICLTETIGLCVENLYRNQTHIDNLSQCPFSRLLEMTMHESFIFDQKYYKQYDGVAMGSPLESTLANVFICHFESIWLENCLTQFKPVVYRRYMDNTFLPFHFAEHVEKFKKYLNKQHKNSALTSEMEQNGSLSFLDIKISHENNKFVTSIY